MTIIETTQGAALLQVIQAVSAPVAAVIQVEADTVQVAVTPEAVHQAVDAQVALHHTQEGEEDKYKLK
jgi:hypothetical protein